MCEQRLYMKKDLARILGVHIRTIELRIHDKSLPAGTRLGNRLYWDKKSFDQWLEEQFKVVSPPSPVSIASPGRPRRRHSVI